MKKYLISKLLSIEWLLNIVALLYNIPNQFKIAGRINNVLNFNGSFLAKTKIKIIGKNNKIDIAPESRIHKCLFFIRGDNCTITIDRHCILSNTELWIEDNDGHISIGSKTTMEGGHIAATEGKTIQIGNDCMFSYRIEIRNGDSHAIYDLSTNKRVNNAKSVIIGNHVWLGSDAKVMKGSKVEDGCIIATGAIISGNCEANSIFGGVPAIKIKNDIYWERERK